MSTSFLLLIQTLTFLSPSRSPAICFAMALMVTVITSDIRVLRVSGWTLPALHGLCQEGSISSLLARTFFSELAELILLCHDIDKFIGGQGSFCDLGGHINGRQKRAIGFREQAENHCMEIGIEDPCTHACE
jgi:hypothetical protein